MAQPMVLKLETWMNDRVGELSGAVPLEEIFRAAVRIDPKVMIWPYLDHNNIFYTVIFPDKSEGTYGGEEFV